MESSSDVLKPFELEPNVMLSRYNLSQPDIESNGGKERVTSLDLLISVDTCRTPKNLKPSD